MGVDLSICIVNHRTPELTVACLESIECTRGSVQLEVFLLNNTADDEFCLRQTAEQYPYVTFLQNRQPRKFAANQNHMLTKANGFYLMPLNADTEMTPGALEELIRYMDAHPAVGIAAPKLIYGDGTLQRSCRNYPGPAVAFLEASGLWYPFRDNRHFGRIFYLCAPHDEPMEPDWISGACYIVRSKAAAQTGYFDAEHFTGLYLEDTDWCLRMQKQKWRVVFHPRAVVIHHESRSPMDSTSPEAGGANFFVYHHLHSTPIRTRLTRAAIVLGFLIRRILVNDPNRIAHIDAYIRIMIRGDHP